MESAIPGRLLRRWVVRMLGEGRGRFSTASLVIIDTRDARDWPRIRVQLYKHQPTTLRFGSEL